MADKTKALGPGGTKACEPGGGACTGVKAKDTGTGTSLDAGVEAQGAGTASQDAGSKTQGAGTGTSLDAGTKVQKNSGAPMVLAASLCFSTGGLLLKMIPWNPLAINGVRNLIAVCVIGLYILATHHRFRINFTVLVGAVCMAGVTTLFAVANKLTTAGNAIVLQYSAPVWIILLMFLFFRKKPGRLDMVTILFVLAGILCFFFESLSTGKILGDVLALLSGLFYAGVFMLNQFEKGDALSSMFLGQLLCGAALSPLVLRETDFSPLVLLSVFLLGAVQVGLAYIFFSIGMRSTDPVTASIINAVEPVLNPVLVAVFYGEMLGALSLAGAAIVIGSIVVYNVKSR